MKFLNHYKIFFSFIVFLPLYCDKSIESHQEHYPIKVPAAVDGTPFGINGQEIKKLIYIIKEIEKLLKGTLDPITKEKVGAYIFQEQNYTLMDFAQLEKKHMVLTPSSKKELGTILEQAKKDFIKISTPFIEQARGVKQITLKFMDEWATKHHRENSHLMHWSKEKDGNEITTFYSETTSFLLLEEFCIDLISFVTDLIQSCPRGWNQFIAIQKGSK